MRFMTIGLALGAISSAALAQNSQWGAFKDGNGAGVGLQAADGAQLMLKCDKPGAREVYAIVATPKNLVPPAESFVMRPAKVQVGDRPTYDDRWRFYERSAVATNKGTERALSRLLADLGEAKTLEVQLFPDTRNRTLMVTHKFNVEGAKDAIAQVFADCQDQLPTS